MSTVAAIASPSRGLLRILGLAFGVAVVVGQTVGVGIIECGCTRTISPLPENSLRISCGSVANLAPEA